MNNKFGREDRLIRVWDNDSWCWWCKIRIRKKAASQTPKRHYDWCLLVLLPLGFPTCLSRLTFFSELIYLYIYTLSIFCSFTSVGKNTRKGCQEHRLNYILIILMLSLIIDHYHHQHLIKSANSVYRYCYNLCSSRWTSCGKTDTSKSCGNSIAYVWEFGIATRVFVRYGGWCGGLAS